tara:strand:+ start:35 stop:142 length:108 start_codon:yes stop_codon:yes gene_type:complete
MVQAEEVVVEEVEEEAKEEKENITLDDEVFFNLFF